MNTYTEDTLDEFGVSHTWQPALILDRVITKRGTCIEMIQRPKWGLACYMDNSIQSCTVDEKLYHESLVHPVMSSVINPKRVCIFGGGEGATAREALKWSSVERVDMYEWDPEVVALFKEKYNQWAQGAWDDTRLNLCHIDVFEAIKFEPEIKYDVIIIDLFDPSDNNMRQWEILFKYLNKWVSQNGAIVMYAGMRNILVDEQPYQKLIKMIDNGGDNWHGIEINKPMGDKSIIPYKVFIPSFSGESTFILLSASGVHNFNKEHTTHISGPIWKSYCTFNW